MTPLLFHPYNTHIVFFLIVLSPTTSHFPDFGKGYCGPNENEPFFTTEIQDHYKSVHRVTKGKRRKKRKTKKTMTL